MTFSFPFPDHSGASEFAATVEKEFGLAVKWDIAFGTGVFITVAPPLSSHALLGGDARIAVAFETFFARHLYHGRKEAEARPLARVAAIEAVIRSVAEDLGGSFVER